MQHNRLYKANCTAITGLRFLKYEEGVKNKYINIHIYGVNAF